MRDLEVNAPNTMLSGLSVRTTLLAGLLFYIGANGQVTHSSPQLDYPRNITAIGESQDFCHPDAVYQQLQAKFIRPPLPIDVRNLFTKVPLRGEKNRWVGTHGWTRNDHNGEPLFHAGTDMLDDEGKDVYAVMDGTAVASPNRGKAGNIVTLIVRVPIGLAVCEARIVYMHLDSFTFKATKQVRIGDKLGTVGRTGYEAKKNIPTHLHIELWTDRSSSKEMAPCYTRDIMGLYGASDLGRAIETATNPKTRSHLCSRPR